MKQFLKDYLTFNKRERRGIVILVLIIVSILLFLFISSFFYRDKSSDFSRFETEINRFSAMVDSSGLIKSKENEHFGNERIPERFFFNPNQLSEKDWLRLGLSEKQIKAVKNFENSGGRFREKQDLKKIYVISEEFYSSVEKYIVIPEVAEDRNTEWNVNQKREKKLLAVDVNKADSATFIKLKGIGPGYARRIIKYRDALGGFSTIDQIMEVYGLPPQLFDTISMYLEIDTSGIRKMNINQCDVETLRKHPYINWNVANAIVAYREKHGLYSNVYDIRKTDLVDDDLYRKIAPYLTLK